jgi:hypothetical protein
MESHLTSKQGSTMPKQRTKTFHQKVLRGNILGAVRCLTNREKGGILYPDDPDEKSGKSVLSVLKSKHLNARTPSTDTLTTYPSLPDFVDLDITKDSIEVTATRRCRAWRDECPCTPAMAAAFRQSKSHPATSFF